MRPADLRASTGVPGVPGAPGVDSDSDADRAAVQVALQAVPLEDPADGPWVAAQWFGGALGVAGFALVAVFADVVLPLMWVAGVLTVVARLAGRRLSPTHPPVGQREWLVVRAVTLAWAVSVGAVLGAMHEFRGVLSWLSLALMVGLPVWVGFRRLRTWRQRPTAPPPWPLGAEALAVLAVVEDSRRIGVHPRRVAALAGLDESRARAGLDALAAEGLVVGARVIAGRESSRVRVTDTGQRRLAEWKRALGWS